MSRYAPSADWYCVFPSPAQPRFLPQPVGEQILDKDSIISALVDVLEGARSINGSAGGRLMSADVLRFLDPGHPARFRFAAIAIRRHHNVSPRKLMGPK